jgi:hypothetical protein
MSLEVLTMWYNEAYLAPFFLKHYAYADKITLVYDADTTDNTLEIVKSWPNVHVVPFRFPDMLDTELKQDFLNAQYRQTECDWVLCVDADEFVFYKDAGDFCYDLRPFLVERPGYHLFYVTLYQIYRHEDDADLDPDRYPVPQRRHGDSNVTQGFNAMYNKPILARKGLNIRWTPGCHAVKHPPLRKLSLRRLAKMFLREFTFSSLRISPFSLLGAHWAMADPVFAVERRVKNRRARLSRNNLAKSMSYHQYTVTEESLMNEFAQHQKDPLVF